MNLQPILYRSLLFMLIFLFMGSARSFAQGSVDLSSKETQIKGSIKYSVVGRYNAEFDSFHGKILIDEKTNTILSVDLQIDTASIQSDCKWCDRIVRSKQLLDTAQYPNIIFKGKDIIKDGSDWRVKGVLEMHGIKKELSFPFKFKVLNTVDSHEKVLDLSGDWSINRKHFNIVWNKLLDHGGVLVGDYINVVWGIKAAIKEEVL